MGNKKVLIDTSIMIEILKNRDKSILHRVDPYAFHSCTIAEFKQLSTATNSGKKQDVRNILQLFTILPFTPEVARKAAEIYQTFRQENMLVKVRDIFTASAAIIYDLPLFTSNTKLFNIIKELELIDIPSS